MNKQKNERLAESASATMESAQEFMQVSLESIELLATIQLEAYKKILSDTSSAIKGISTAKNHKEFTERVNQLATYSVENNISNCHKLYSVMQEIQAKYSKLLESQAQNSQHCMTSAVEGLVNFNQSNSVVSDSVKRWVNNVNQAVTNMNKIATQIPEFMNKTIQATIKSSTKK